MHGKSGADQSQENQGDDDDDRAFGHHAHKASKGLFLNGDIHFTMLVLSHNAPFRQVVDAG